MLQNGRGTWFPSLRLSDRIAVGQTLLTLLKQPQRPLPTIPDWLTLGPDKPAPTDWPLQTVE